MSMRLTTTRNFFLHFPGLWVTRTCISLIVRAISFSPRIRLNSLIMGNIPGSAFSCFLIIGGFRMNDRGEGISRREFLHRIALLGSLAACYPVEVIAQKRLQPEAGRLPAWCSEDPWKTLAEVQQHLFPAS